MMKGSFKISRISSPAKNHVSMLECDVYYYIYYNKYKMKIAASEELNTALETCAYELQEKRRVSKSTVN